MFFLGFFLGPLGWAAIVAAATEPAGMPDRAVAINVGWCFSGRGSDV